MSDADALLKAAKSGQAAVVKNLLTTIRVNTEADLSEALSWAAHNGHVETVKLLLKSGAPINAKDQQGNTALHWACYNGHEEAVYVLLAHGADERALNNNNLTPSRFAYIGQSSHTNLLALEKTIENMVAEINQLRAKVAHLKAQQHVDKSNQFSERKFSNTCIMGKMGFYLR